MDISAPAESAPALEPIPPAPGPLARAGFLLVTGLILGLFLGAALFGHRPGGRMAQRAWTGPAQPRQLAGGDGARALPPGHPPVEGFSEGFGLPSDDSSGCPYLDSADRDGAAYEDGADEAAPLPRARPFLAPSQSPVNGPI